MNHYTNVALEADSLCLGAHWVYDQDELERQFPNGVTEPTDPLSPYHPNRKAGQNTHLGDQTRFLSECIQQNGGTYSRDAWKQYWLEKMKDYDGYLDGATKQTLSSHGDVPADSTEFAPVGRSAPLFDLGLELDEAIQQAQCQASLTHQSDAVSEACEFLVRTHYKVLSGESVKEAFQQVVDENSFPALGAKDAFQKALNANPNDPMGVAKIFGQSCSISSAFPLSLYLALHFTGEQQGSINALMGGDSAARALFLACLPQ